jgi:hypothetical protein
MKKHLIYRCELSTEKSTTDDEMKNLHDVIIQVSKHKEIPRRYFWFEEILLFTVYIKLMNNKLHLA